MLELLGSTVSYASEVAHPLLISLDDKSHEVQQLVLLVVGTKMFGMDPRGQPYQ
jgi:hypothetical protein